MRIIVLAAVVVLVAAGCGGSSRPARTTASRGVPRALASQWEARASAVADAAAAGDNCRALQLATLLRDDVIAKESQVPSRLQSPLLAGVNALADRLVCQPPPQTVTVPDKKPPKPPHKHEDHHKHHDPGDENKGNRG